MKTSTKRKPMTFRRQLIRLGACKEALKWVGNKTLAQAWRECEYACRMEWLVSRFRGELALNKDQRTSVFVAWLCDDPNLYRKAIPARMIARAMKERFG